MLDISKCLGERRVAAGAAALVFVLGVAGFAIGAGPAATIEPVRCEIRATSASGMTTLEGVVEADVAISGSYELKVKSSGGGGSSNVVQGGDFTASPDSPTTVGKVMVGGSASDFDTKLTITANGKTILCPLRVEAPV